jgi:hypothetical protein
MSAGTGRLLAAAAALPMTSAVLLTGCGGEVELSAGPARRH